MKKNILLAGLTASMLLAGTVLAGDGMDPKTGMGTPTKGRPPRVQPNYGGASSTAVMFNVSAFTCRNSNCTYSTANGYDRYRTGGDGFYDAAVQLPSGAAITRFTLDWYDTNPTENLQAYLMECPASGALCTTIATVESSGDAEDGTTSFDIAVPETVENLNNRYLIRVRFDTTDSSLRLYDAIVHYKLVVSDAGATAMFDDVPVGDPTRKFIEALANAGITAGCGDGTNFCPDALLTRRQMAIFLAAALGLHHPN